MPSPVSSYASAHCTQLESEGYCCLRGVLSPALIQCSQEILEAWVEDRAAAWSAEGLLEETRPDLDFLNRFSTIWHAAGKPRYCRSPRGELVALEPQKVFSMLTDPDLLRIAAELLGTEDLAIHSAWNSRPRTPDANFTDTPWHQDGQYARVDAHLDALTIWYPLHAVDETNSCLAVAPGSQGMALQDNYRYEENGFVGIERKQAKELPCEPIAMEPGDALCFLQLTPHRAMPNRSNAMRWSMDIRFMRGEESTERALEQGIRVGCPDKSQNTTFDAWFAKWSS